ncbi:helix-turn-helix domain-containing protein [Rhodococcus sp. AW25M09]|uniref:helix-turn-helix domain-containing protein n=1 Tax=Rhodococcus sp. AW25M09 TaxID=1268303 RepID=UPI0022B61BC4|nr:helix-turn-helix domain-containing protein [Rhodococcus sp. AW25M09]
MGVGPRTLQAAFQRERGTTPLEELRRARLARAHADLLDATPDGTSVTEVATRWGFFHLGRFSQFYRSEFGLSPSQTLAS